MFDIKISAFSPPRVVSYAILAKNRNYSSSSSDTTTLHGFGLFYLRRVGSNFSVLFPLLHSPSILFPSFGSYSYKLPISNFLNWVYIFHSVQTSPPFYSLCFYVFNPLAHNDVYIRRTAQLTSRLYILIISSTNILTEYFKHAAHSPFFFFLQDAIYFIVLSFLVPVLFTF